MKCLVSLWARGGRRALPSIGNEGVVGVYDAMALQCILEVPKHGLSPPGIQPVRRILNMGHGISYMPPGGVGLDSQILLTCWTIILVGRKHTMR